MKYPKIDTLYVRDKKTFKVTSEFRNPEYVLIKEWLITEKIHGTNIHIRVAPDWSTGAIVSILGRTDKVQIPSFLMEELRRIFSSKAFSHVFDEDVTEAWLFGEGYGEKIQKGGGNYREGVSFRLFDVVVVGSTQPWWLNWSDVEDIAAKLNIRTVPVLRRDAPVEIIRACVDGPSIVAAEESGKDYQREGIVARTEPLLFDRRGRRIMWKLKTQDFEKPS